VCVEQRIVIGTDASWYTLPVDGDVEEAAHVGTFERTAMHADADQATRKLVHHHEHPVAAEHDGLAAKEIDAPEAVYGMADE
jgi:hypothetical protein